MARIKMQSIYSVYFQKYAQELKQENAINSYLIYICKSILEIRREL